MHFSQHLFCFGLFWLNEDKTSLSFSALHLVFLYCMVTLFVNSLYSV